MKSSYPNPAHLAEADWLRAHLTDTNLRVIDARFDVRAGATGKLEEVSGRLDYQAGHIPGAQFVDLKADLATLEDPTNIIGPEAFSALMNRIGIGPDSSVVIYDDRGGAWAARLWWALRYYGHEDVMLLNGGLRAWREAGGDLEFETSVPSSARFVTSVQANLRVTKADVLKLIDTPHARIVDALPPPFYLGQAGLYTGHRKGHVPSARNVPADLNLDPTMFRVKPIEALKELWRDAEISPDHRVITYCGGGVFAAFALFILQLMGHDDAALYDASWQEWGRDEMLPIEIGPPKPIRP